MTTRERQLVGVAVVLASALSRARERSRPTDPDRREPQPARDYETMVADLCALMQDALPPGAEVLVVSRGDERMLRVDGIRARHFPADGAGRWAGHHPAIGDAAALVTGQRGGATAIAVPATSSWWFDTYPEFAELLAEGRLRVELPGVGSIWDLPAVPVEGAGPAPRAEGAAGYESAAGHLRELVAALVDPDDVVLVISRGDPALVQHGSIVVRHFPGDTEGGYLGHPRDDRDAMDLLDSAVLGGASWLVVPSDARWWAEHYPRFWAHVHRQPNLVAHRPGVGTLIRLEPLT